MRKIGSLFVALIFAVMSIPQPSLGAAKEAYLPESTNYQQVKWEYKETPPQRPKPKILNAANYEAKWKIDNPLLFSLVQDQNGILYNTDSDNNVHAVYPNGKVKWTLHLDMGFDSVIYLIVGQDGTIYAYSTDPIVQPRLTSIYALSPEGKVKWKLSPSAGIYSQFDTQFAGDSHGNFVYFTEEGLVSRNQKGEINWSNKDIQTDDPSNYSVNMHWANLYIDSEDNLYVNSAEREIVSLNSKGAERWRTEPQDYLNPFYYRFHPYFSNGRLLYMATNDGLFALKAEDGSIVKIPNKPDLSDIRSSGVPTDGKTGYYIVSRGVIQKIGFDGILKWSYVARPTEKSGIANIDTLSYDNDGNVYCYTGVGSIIGLNSEGQEIFVFLRNAFYHKVTDVVVGKNGNIYSNNMDIGLVAFGKKQIQVYIDNLYLPLSVAPIKDNDTVLVPFRAFFEQMGLTVGWDPVSQTITGTKEGLSIQLSIGSKTAYVNGQAKQLTAAPKMANNSAYVPVRFVGEALGKNVSWDDRSSSVNIDSK